MNIKTADKLCTLRKQHHLTQEELADKLGVSRQAISKWERSEASPDTDNLIELANIYGITLDELLDREDAINVINDNKGSNQELKEETNIFKYSDDGYVVTINNDDILLNSGDETRKYSLSEYRNITKKAKTTSGLITSIFTIVVTIIYLLLGFLLKDWVHFYFLFILIPFVGSITESIILKRINMFACPVLIAAIYCGISQFTGLWHPLWIMFLIVPIFDIIAFIINKKTHSSDLEVLEDAINDYDESRG